MLKDSLKIFNNITAVTIIGVTMTTRQSHTSVGLTMVMMNTNSQVTGIEVEIFSTPLYAQYQTGDYRWSEHQLYQEALELIPYEEPHRL